MAGDKESKTEEPTDKRRKEAREKGSIARSQDLVSWTALLAGLFVLKSTLHKGGDLVIKLMDQMSVLIAEPDEQKAMAFMRTALFDAAVVLVPLALFFMALGLLGHLAQVRFVFSVKGITPDFKKINPMNGFKRIYSKHSLFELFKQITKIAIIGFIAYRTLWSTLIHMGANGPYSLDVLVHIALDVVSQFVQEVAIAGVVIGAVDYFMQRKRTTGDLKMTKEEVKQEHKSSEGSPELKGKIRQKQRAMSRNRMMASIRDADVVVVNPVHVAVALKYQMNGQAGAPKVVAKGAGFVAEKIRDLADEHKIPMIQDIPLARTLHRTCEVDQEIPMEMFEAVARVLAFVFGLKNRGNGYGFHKMPGTPDLAEYEAEEARRTASDASTGAEPSLV